MSGMYISPNHVCWEPEPEPPLTCETCDKLHDVTLADGDVIQICTDDKYEYLEIPEEAQKLECEQH